MMRVTWRLRQIVIATAILAAGISPERSPLAAESCVQRDTPNPVYPGDPRWAANLNVYPDNQNLGVIGITGANPRSGNGSLAASTTGSLFDWAFFQRTASPGAAWGLLSAINCLTFDWFRADYTLPPDAPGALLAETWQEQTPVLRLMVKDVVDNQEVLSQLVWERWYNTKGVVDPTVNDTWHFEDLTGQQFWRHFDGGTLYTNLGCSNGSFTTSSNLDTYDLGGWVSHCYSAQAEIYGIMIGLGSSWPGEYHGNLDNVQLGFAGQDGFAVEDNFELPGDIQTAVPEPASLLLLATGLASLAVAGLFRKRADRNV